MESAAQIALLERAVAHLRAGTRDVEPAPSHFEAGIYCDEARAAAERATLFTEFPIVVAVSAQLQGAGSFVTRDVNGIPVLVSRQEDGSVRAFLNICRHRGAKVVSEASGTCDRVHRCPYHAWSYGIDGALQFVPQSEHFEGLDLDSRNLVPLRVKEMAGLIFVVPNQHSTCDPDAYLGEYRDDLNSFGLPDFEFYDGRTVRMNHNWKMTIEGNQETYHFDVLHRQTAGRRFRGILALFDNQGPHSRSLLMHKRFRERSLPESRDEWSVLEHGDLVYCLFPNTLVLLSHFAAHVLTVFPDGPNAAVAHGCTLVPPGTRESYRREFFDVYWATMLEDVEVSETIQASAQAVPDASWCRGRSELLIRKFIASVDGAIAGELTPDSVCADLGASDGPVS